MQKKILVGLLVLGLSVGTASAQFGSGIVYDPTNYHNALLRYYQLQQHLAQLQKTYTQTVTAYNLALQMSRNLHNMPARYRAQFSNWRNVTANNTYGNIGLVIYLLVYVLMNMGAFGVIISLRRRGIIGDNVDDMTGLAQKAPGMAAPPKQ